MKKTILTILTAALLLQTAFVLSACGDDEVSFDELGTFSFTEATKAATVDSVKTSTTAPATSVPGSTAAATTQKPTQKATSATSKVTKTTSQANNNNNNNNNNSSSNSDSGNSGTTSKPATTAAPATKPQPVPGSFSESDTNFILNGKTVSLDENMDSVLSKLGNAQNVYSAPSCHGDGEDKTFEYDGFTVYSYPNGGQDKVLEVSVTAVGINTAKGIGVGSTLNDLIAAYGNNYADEGARLVYASGDKKLQFYVDGDVINEISYYLDN